MRLESVHGYGRGRPARSVVDVTEDLAQPSTSTSAAKWLGIALATIVGIPVLLVLAVLVTYGVQRATPEDYPKAAPQTMADRAGARSQEAYDVLGFDATLPGGEFNSSRPVTATRTAWRARPTSPSTAPTPSPTSGTSPTCPSPRRSPRCAACATT